MENIFEGIEHLREVEPPTSLENNIFVAIQTKKERAISVANGMVVVLLLLSFLGAESFFIFKSKAKDNSTELAETYLLKTNNQLYDK